MTQRLWTTEDGWTVLTGWDRPLQHFFVNIDRICHRCLGRGETDERICVACDGNGNEYLFNNLDAPKGYTDAMGGMTIEQVAQVLSEKLTLVPDMLLTQLRDDKALNRGSERNTYGVLGKAKGEGEQ
jgi:hypothetical protein